MMDHLAKEEEYIKTCIAAETRKLFDNKVRNLISGTISVTEKAP